MASTGMAQKWWKLNMKTVKTYSITYDLGNHRNDWPKVTFKGTLEKAKVFAQRYREEQHIPNCTVHIMEIVK